MAEPTNNAEDRLPKELEQLEEDVIRKIEQKVDESRQIEEKAKEELAEADESNVRALTEQSLLMLAAAIMIIILPFLHYFLGVFLTLFAVAVSFVAGLAPSKEKYGAAFTMIIATGGMLFFEYSAIFEYHASQLSLLFWIFQLLALIFLLATFFGVGTYRKKILGK
ncbi:MAG: hypothetical protein KGJ13_00945 [Patescibacteria group bacterium]|nr:hypothetical protein [Patescibacteria group bacterium]